jgi:hypothetical protein
MDPRFQRPRETAGVGTAEGVQEERALEKGFLVRTPVPWGSGASNQTISSTEKKWLFSPTHAIFLAAHLFSGHICLH